MLIPSVQRFPTNTMQYIVFGILLGCFAVYCYLASLGEFIIPSEVASQCPDGWTIFQGSCYLFAIQPSHFTEAEHFCRQRGSHLVHIETANENKFLISFAAHLKDANYWIGLTDMPIAGIWKWTDTDTIATFTDWYPGDPNNERTENCAALYNHRNYHWVDEPCSHPWNPICERRVDADFVGK